MNLVSKSTRQTPSVKEDVISMNTAEKVLGGPCVDVVLFNSLFTCYLLSFHLQSKLFCFVLFLFFSQVTWVSSSILCF